MTLPGPLRWITGRASPPTLARIYLLAGAVILAVGLLVYFQTLSVRLEKQSEADGRLAARLVAFTTLAMQLSDSTAVEQFQDAMHSLNFPVIVTNDVGRPLTWNGHVDERTLSPEQILSEDLDNPGPVMRDVLRALRSMDAQHEPVPMVQPVTGAPISLYLHYGSPSLLSELRLIPWITIGIAAVFGFVGLLILRNLKRAEQGMIWAGMAKESAHQMGTPISSLMGWMEVLKDEVRPEGDRAVLPGELFDEVVREIGADAGRLNRVAARFSQIGSRPKLVESDLAPLVQETLEYFRRRAPQGVSLELESPGDLPPVRLNRELMIWVVENLIKNAINAMPEGGGSIRMRLYSTRSEVGVAVRDTGRGVSPGLETQIFRPGVSTRERGWGLGLPLSRRIVEEFHHGRLDLTWTAPGKGAEFTVRLPRGGGRV